MHFFAIFFCLFEWKVWVRRCNCALGCNPAPPVECACLPHLDLPPIWKKNCAKLKHLVSPWLTVVTPVFSLNVKWGYSWTRFSLTPNNKIIHSITSTFVRLAWSVILPSNAMNNAKKKILHFFFQFPHRQFWQKLFTLWVAKFQRRTEESEECFNKTVYQNINVANS